MASAKPVTAVAVDTTEFFGDFKLIKSPWTRTRLAALRGTLQLWVPELVVRETARHYEQQVSSHFTKLSDAEQAIAGLAWGTDEPWATDEHYDEAITRLKSGYTAWLRARLTRVGVTILPLPSMTHEEIAGRMLREERPFRRKGGQGKSGPDGYRDMLIWASIAEYAAAQKLGPADTLYFVTGNHNDFCDDQDRATVAAVLLADLTGADAKAKQLALFSRAVSKNVPTVHRVDNLTGLDALLPGSADDGVELTVQDALATNTNMRDKLQEALEQAASALAGQPIADADRSEKYPDGLDFDELRLPVESPRLRELDINVRSVRATVYGTDPDSEEPLILAQVTVKADAYIEGYLDAADYDENSGFTGSLVNDRVFEVEGDRRVVLHFNARVEPDGAVESLVLDKAVPLGSSSGG